MSSFPNEAEEPKKKKSRVFDRADRSRASIVDYALENELHSED